VLSRLRALRGPEWRKDAPYYNLAEQLLHRDAPGDWNQALMELGATLCSVRRPACRACPVRTLCRGLALGMVEALPEGRARRAPVDVIVAAAIVERQGRLLLVRRSEGRLMGRLWEVPQTSLESHGLKDLAQELRERHGLEVVPGPLAVLAEISGLPVSSMTRKIVAGLGAPQRPLDIS
jgi:A/G-specific adenine glycosylase